MSQAGTIMTNTLFTVASSVVVAGCRCGAFDAPPHETYLIEERAQYTIVLARLDETDIGSEQGVEVLGL